MASTVSHRFDHAIVASLLKTDFPENATAMPGNV